ncbi:MAG: hypothetical protein KDA51_20150, partial [Planctomycetales bacterium]|nr:hypothetical protein [Planctomycetales bacterium]
TPAGKEEQTALREKFRQDILAVLTPEQNAQWAAPQPTQKLMFQFRDMKWEDVLNWFASQQDLTLVMDRTPGGTFTYSDTRSYSPSEGIDLLNSVLMTRGFTLVRREKMLVVMELSANIPLELLPRVPLEQLDERGRFEIVSVLFPLAGRPVDAVLQEVKPYLSSYGRAIPLARGGQLLVVETAGKMSTINELIGSVPVPKENPKPEPTPPPQPVFAAYALGELDSGAALETIRKLIPSEQITVDGRTGVLSAFVIPAQQTAIKSAIDQMQASHAELPDTETVAYRFTGIKPEELQRQIAALAPRAILTVTADRALVTADVADQQVVRSALDALDIQPVAVDRALKVFEVSKSSAEQVATALRTFLPNSFVVSNAATGNVLVRGSQQDLQFAQDVVDMWRESQATAAAELHAIELDRPATAVWLTTVKQVVPEATLWLSESLPNVPQHLMLLGSQQDFATVEKLLPQLLSVLPEADRRELKIYPLTENQRARQLTLSTLPAELSDIKLVTGQSGQELLVWAAPDQHTLFAELLKQLDQPLTTTSIVPKSYSLNVQDAATVTTLLTAEFPTVQLTVNTAGDELTVLASPDQHARIAERIAEFNAELPSKRELLVESYAVDGMTAVALQQALMPLLGTAQTTLDSQGERLFIRADAETHAELHQMATALGAKPAAGRQKVVLAYPLEHTAATNVKLLLDQIVRDATVLADDALRQVVVTGSAETQSQVKAAIDQIDREGKKHPAAELHALELDRPATAVWLTTVKQIVPEATLWLSESLPNVPQHLMLLGSQQDFAKVEKLLPQLLSVLPVADRRELKIYPLTENQRARQITLATLPAEL